ncbi:MAG: hypothetical protein PWP04_343 [Candidatus Atribacteria bacterium]|nr:hypothetical protein [Candidatus Atribacteria bacterium]
MRRIFEKFTPEDYRFISEVVSASKEKESQKTALSSLLNDPDVLNVVLDNQNLFQRVALDDTIFVRISPYLYFEILLRQSLRDIQREFYTLEQVGYKTRVPVFDGQKVVEIFSQDMIKDYLVELLVSFVRVENFTILIRRGRGIYFKQTISNMDFDFMSETSQKVEEPYRFLFVKRAADIALFLCGVFSEQLFATSSNFKARRMAKALSRGEELEKYGQELYRQACNSELAREYQLDTVLQCLAEHFSLSKKPLNVLSDRYLCFKKYNLFDNLFN